MLQIEGRRFNTVNTDRHSPSGNQLHSRRSDVLSGKEQQQQQQTHVKSTKRWYTREKLSLVCDMRIQMHGLHCHVNCAYSQTLGH